MNDLFDSGNFKERDYLSLVWKRKRDHPLIWKKKRHYLPLIQKDSVNHIHGLVVYVKQGLPFVQDLSLEKSADSYWCFQLALLLFLYWLPSPSLCMLFDAILSNIDEVLSINTSAYVFVFGDLMFIIRTG